MESVTSNKIHSRTDSKTVDRILTWVKCHLISHTRPILSIPVNTTYCTSELLLTVFTHHLLTSQIKYVKMLTLVCAAHFMTIMYGATTSLAAVILLPTCKETVLKGTNHNEGVIT
jgi:Na+/H+ antiporter NhaB